LNLSESLPVRKKVPEKKPRLKEPLASTVRTAPKEVSADPGTRAAVDRTLLLDREEETESPRPLVDGVKKGTSSLEWKFFSLPFKRRCTAQQPLGLCTSFQSN
jgi:hypothetical protein